MSDLHRVLEKLPSLVTLRVFDCHRTRALYEFVSGARFVWSFETAMFPGRRHGISSYEYYISPSTKTVALHSVSGESIRRLRLTGFIRLDEPLEKCKNLQDLTIYAVTGNYFDQRPLAGMNGISLQSFEYDQGDKLGFEIQTEFLSSILSGSHSSLRRLVLLRCNKLLTAGLVSCLQSMTALEYFSLSFFTVNELDADIVAALPLSTHTLKLKITHTLYTRPFIQEELAMCETLKRRWLTHPVTPKLVYLHLPHVISCPSDEEEWTLYASENGVQLYLGDWTASERI